MHAFVVDHKPRSHQQKNRAGKRKMKQYYETIVSGLNEQHPNIQPYSDQLYGVIYYFNWVRSTIDPDNMSKPVWDALKGVMYKDDSAVRLRLAGIIDIPPGGVLEFDMTSLTEEISQRIQEAYFEKKPLMYIEVGALDNPMFRVALEKEAL